MVHYSHNQNQDPDPQDDSKKLVYFGTLYWIKGAAKIKVTADQITLRTRLSIKVDLRFLWQVLFAAHNSIGPLLGVNNEDDFTGPD